MKFRPLARNTVVRLLELMPLPALQRVQRSYIRGTSEGRTNRVASALMTWIKHRPVDPDVADFEIAGEPGVRFGNDGSSIARTVFWLGKHGYEGFELTCWETFCRGANDVVEMGANVGYFTLHGALANPQANYSALEPHPISANSIRHNLQLNQVDNVNVIESAVVGERTSGTMKLFLPDQERETTPTGAFLTGGERIDRPASESVIVSVVEARKLIQQADLVKLDIEGYEHHVIGSSLPEIRTQRPSIFVEVRRNTTELRALISGLAQDDDYLIFALAPDGLHPVGESEIRTVVLQETYRTRDVILVPSEKRGITEGLMAAVGAA